MLWHGKNFRGIINKAKQMIFDNTGTDLISTNAEDAIKEVNSNLSANYLGSQTGATAITLPSEWSELYVDIYSEVNSFMHHNMTILKVFCTPNIINTFRQGETDQSGHIAVNVTDTTVYLVAAYSNGLNIRDSCTTTVYYK